MHRLIVTALIALAAACQAPSSTQAKTSEGDASTPVARFTGGQVTAGELEAMTYENKKQALEQIVVKKIVEAKAKAEGITPEAYVKREVQDKIKPPSDAELKAFYDEQKGRGQQLPPLEQIKDQVVQYLQQNSARRVQGEFLEKLRAEAKVEILLQPPRVVVAAEGPSKGEAKAPITIVEFSDFECPYCSKAEESVKQVMKEYGGKVRLVYRDFPLPFHPNAQKAAEAAHCAGDQGKYWEMHEKLFANQKALAVSDLKGHAKELGLDGGKFEKCLDGGDKVKIVEASKQAGSAVGVTGTPAFFVNGVMLSGAQPFSEFKSLIDKELAKK